MLNSTTSDNLSAIFDDYGKLCEKQKLDLKKEHKNFLKVSIHVVSLVNIASFAILFINYPLISSLVTGKLKLFGKNAAPLWFSISLIVFILSTVLLAVLFYQSAIRSVDSKLVSEYCKFADYTEAIVEKLKEDFAVQHNALSHLLDRYSELESHVKKLSLSYDKFSNEIRTKLQLLYTDHSTHVKSIESKTNELENKISELNMRLSTLIVNHQAFGKSLDQFLDDIDGILKDGDIDLQLKIQILQKMHTDCAAQVNISNIKKLMTDLVKEIDEKVQDKDFSLDKFKRDINNLSKKLQKLNSEINENNCIDCIENFKSVTNKFISDYNGKKVRKNYASKSKKELADLTYILYLVFFLDLSLSRFLVMERSRDFIDRCKDARRLLLNNDTEAYERLVKEGTVVTAESILKDAMGLLNDMLRDEGLSCSSVNSAESVFFSATADSNQSVPSTSAAGGSGFVVSDVSSHINEKSPASDS